MFDTELIVSSRLRSTYVNVPIPVVQVETTVGDQIVSVGVVETGRPLEVVEAEDCAHGDSRPLFTKSDIAREFLIEIPRLQSGGRVTLPRDIARMLPVGSWMARYWDGAIKLEPALAQPSHSANTAPVARVDKRSRLTLGAGIRDMADLHEGARLVVLIHRDGTSLIVSSLDVVATRWLNVMLQPEEDR